MRFILSSKNRAQGTTINLECYIFIKPGINQPHTGEYLFA